MQTNLINSELHVLFPFRLYMDDEDHIISPAGNQVLETQFHPCYNIGDGIFTESHTVVEAVHHCLMGHCNSSAITLKLHFRFWLSGLLQ